MHYFLVQASYHHGEEGESVASLGNGQEPAPLACAAVADER